MCSQPENNLTIHWYLLVPEFICFPFLSSSINPLNKRSSLRTKYKQVCQCLPWEFSEFFRRLWAHFEGWMQKGFICFFLWYHLEHLSINPSKFYSQVLSMTLYNLWCTFMHRHKLSCLIALNNHVRDSIVRAYKYTWFK